MYIAARSTFRDGGRTNALFYAAERFGAHFQPAHFYSPVPNTATIPTAAFTQTYDHVQGLELDVEAHTRWLHALAGFATALGEVREDNSEPDAALFYWRNSQLAATDAILYYCLIRHLQPRRVVEIGAGNSSMIAALALRANGAGDLTCVEPYPSLPLRTLVQRGDATLIEQFVQDVPMETFDALDANDILFIDSTHVSAIGSDVNHEVFRILPRLKPGVMVHVHDIFHPNEYPERWVKEERLFWNEQYLVMAFLAYNSAFRIEFSSRYIETALGDVYQELFSGGHPSGFPVGGGSLWIRKVA